MKKFFPKVSVFIPATRTTGIKTEYKISYGSEEWSDGQFHDVYKVQMVYEGKVSGRQAPSYPANTNDYERVRETIENLMMDNACEGPPPQK